MKQSSRYQQDQTIEHRSLSSRPSRPRSQYGILPTPALAQHVPAGHVAALAPRSRAAASVGGSRCRAAAQGHRGQQPFADQHGPQIHPSQAAERGRRRWHEAASERSACTEPPSQAHGAQKPPPRAGRGTWGAALLLFSTVQPAATWERPLVPHVACALHRPGMTPLMTAVTHGKHKVIKALLKAGPTATTIANAEGYSVMHVVAFYRLLPATTLKKATSPSAHQPTSPPAHQPTRPHAHTPTRPHAHTPTSAQAHKRTSAQAHKRINR